MDQSMGRELITPLLYLDIWLWGICFTYVWMLKTLVLNKKSRFRKKGKIQMEKVNSKF